MRSTEDSCTKSTKKSEAQKKKDSVSTNYIEEKLIAKNTTT